MARVRDRRGGQTILFVVLLSSFFFSLAGLSVPAFYLGILLLLIFSVRLNWFPVVGAGTPGDPMTVGVSINWRR